MLIIILVISIVPVNLVFGQEWVTLATDKTEYVDGDMVVIHGTVFQLYSSTPITITVVAPNGNIVYLDQIPVNYNKIFNTEFKVGGSLMKMPGDYKIIAQYGSETRKTEIQFKYGNIIEPKEIIPQKEITVEGYLITNTMTSGEVINIIPNKNENMLTVNIHNTNDSGALIMAIPRNVLDSIINEKDSEFFAFIDNNNIDIEEVDSNEFERTVIIKYPQGTKSIEIIGTHVIPEFGDIISVILLISMIGTIIIVKLSLLTQSHNSVGVKSNG
jgi:hypothetical protein